MSETAQSTNYWRELWRAYGLLADESECNARGDIDRVDHLTLARECCQRLLDALPSGPGTEERIHALLALTAAFVMQGAIDDAERAVAEAWGEVQALRDAMERESEGNDSTA